MKTLTAKKIVAMLTAFSLTFLQVLPAGVAAVAPVDQIDGTSVSTSEKPATDTTAKPDNEPVKNTSTTTDFQMDTGGIVKASATDPEVASVSTEESAAVEDSTSEEQTNEELQARIAQLLEEARVLEERAATEVQQAAELNERAAQARTEADELIRKSQTEMAIAQSMMQQGQSILASAQKEMASVVARETKVREQLAAYEKMKPTPEVLRMIANLKNQLSSLSSQKASIMKKMANASEILRNAQRHQQLAVAAKNEATKRLQLASALSQQSASRYALAQTLLAQAAAKTAEANELKQHIVPPEVEQYVSNLQEQMGGGFEVTAVCENGSCRISVTDSKVYAKAPTSGLHEMSFVFPENGLVDPTTLQASYYSVDGDIQVDAALLFEALQILPDNATGAALAAALANYERNIALANQESAAGASDADREAAERAAGEDAQDDANDHQNRMNTYQQKISAANACINGDIAACKSNGWPTATSCGREYVPQSTITDLQKNISVWTQYVASEASAKAAALNDASRHFSASQAYASQAAQHMQKAAAYANAAKNYFQQVIAYQKELNPLTLVAMTKISVTKVENGAIFFTEAGKNYKAYRGTDGKVKVEEVVTIPPAVQSFVDQLQTGLGSNYTVEVSPAGDLYQVSVKLKGQYEECTPDGVCHTVAIMPAEGAFTHIDFNITSDGVLDGVQQVNFAGVDNVDGQLLFEAMGVCPQGQVCTMQVVSQIESLKKMTQVVVTKVENGAIFYTLETKNYKTYRDSNGTVKVEEIVSTPPAVQTYVDNLQQQVGSNFKVTATLQKDGKYLITVADALVYAKAPTSGLHEMSFVFPENGLVDPTTLQASYYSVDGDIQVDAALLFEALQILPDNATGAALAAALANYERNIALANQESAAGASDADRAAAERAAGEDAQDDANYHQSRIDQFQNEINKANSCINSSTGNECRQYGYTDQPGRCSSSLRAILQQSIATWSSYVANEANAKAAALNDASRHFSASQAYASQAAQHMQKAAAYANAAKNYFQQVIQYQKELNPLTLVAMTKISVTKVENGVIFFTEAGKNYKAYRGTDGKVKVEEVVTIPSAVQGFVDQLNQQLAGSGYAVTATTLQPDGTYLVSLASTIKQATQGHLGNMSFVLSGEGIVTSISQVTYVDVPNVDGQLLYDGMKLLEASFHPADSSWMPPPATYQARMISLMTQISVTKVENGAIFFTKEGINYRCYRDANGTVKLQIVIENTYFEAIAKADILAVINSSLSGTDRDLALAALNGMPANTVYYKVTDEAGNVIGYQCELQPLDPSTVQKLWIPQSAAAPVSSKVEIYAQGQKTGELQAFVLGPTGPALTFSMMPAPAQPVPADMVKIYNLQTGQLSSVIKYDAEGRVIEVINYTYQNILPPEVLQAAMANLSQAEKDQLNAAMLDVGPNTQYSVQMGENGSKSWIWTSADGTKTYVLSTSSVTTVLTPGSAEATAFNNFQASLNAAAAENDAAQADVNTYNNELDAMHDDQDDADYHQSRINQFQSEINKANSCIYSSTGNECRAAGYTDQTGPASAALKQTLQQNIATWSSYIVNEAKGKSDALNAAANHASRASAAANQAQQHTSNAANYAAQAQAYYRTIASLVNPDGTMKTTVVWNFSTTQQVNLSEVVVNVSQGFGALQAAAQAAQPGTTITVTGEGTLSGANLVIPEGVTLNVPNDQTHLDLGMVQVGGSVPANSAQGQTGSVISSTSTLVSTGTEGTISGGAISLIPAITTGQIGDTVTGSVSDGGTLSNDAGIVASGNSVMAPAVADDEEGGALGGVAGPVISDVATSLPQIATQALRPSVATSTTPENAKTITWGIDYSSVKNMIKPKGITLQQMKDQFWAYCNAAFEAWAAHIAVNFVSVGHQASGKETADIVIRVVSEDAMIDRFGNAYTGYGLYYPKGSVDLFVNGSDAKGNSLEEMYFQGINGGTAGFVAVLIHELGHVLGIHHIDGVGSIMDSRYRGYDTSLDPSDSAVIQAQNKYGAAGYGAAGEPGETEPTEPVSQTPVAVNLTVPVGTGNGPQRFTLPMASGGNSNALGDLSYSIASQPSWGTLVRDPDYPSDPRKYVYTPAPDYSGPDSFTYKVSDGTSDSNIAIVNLFTNSAAVAFPNPVPSLTNQAVFTVNYTLNSGEVKTQTFNLREGKNQNLVIVGTDARGIVHQYKLPAVELDTKPPMVNVFGRVPSLTNNPSLTVSYLADGKRETKTFSLAEGSNANLSITVTDAAGNVTVKTLSPVVLDTTPPAIVMTTQLPTLTNQRVLKVNYTEDGVVKQQTFYLREGNNTNLVIKTKDKVGNETVLKLPPVKLDTKLPVISVKSSIPISTDQTSITVRYTVDGGAEQTQTFDLIKGTNKIKITATDEAGNQSTIARSVVKKTV